ncbi:polysaccharide biosynthesis/export family protein [Rhizorhabdus argentea]|uniref:polysaccharide biosynthesis/export family protein n=1 Tax=Rhizorhabdus argentea TaxID=1387174 RepID=UPI0030EB7F3C
MKFWFIACLMLLGGCAYQGAYPLQTASVGNSAGQNASGATEADYPLSPSDKLHITVFNEPTLSGDYAVGVNGMIAFPLVGPVKAAGASASELSEALRALLGQGLVRNPSVSVEVLSFRPFYVLGEVNRAGEYPYSSGMTVMQAIASAQGFSYRANKAFIYLKRVRSDREEKVFITPTLQVYPGDTIRVAERYF